MRRFRDGFDGCILVFGWNLLGLDVDVFLEVVASKKLVVNRVDATTCAFHALDALAVRLRLLFEFRMPQDQQLVAVDGDADQHDGEHRHDREATDADGETLASGWFGLLQFECGLQRQIMTENPSDSIKNRGACKPCATDRPRSGVRIAVCTGHITSMSSSFK